MSIRLLTLLAVALLIPVQADARWSRLHSPNFEFIGDAPAAQIRRVAERLERFREVMARALPGAIAVSPVPTIVVVFATDRAMTSVKPLFRGNTIEVGGYMQSGEDLNYIIINSENIDFAMLAILHEYAHVLVRNGVGSVPVWVNEGLAEFYDVMQGLEGGKNVVIGRAPAPHVELLKGSTLMPIKQLLAVDHNSPVYNEGSRRNVFYAESWALVHYLTLGSKERAPQFTKYLAALRSGVEPDRAFSEAFGPDPTVLDRELFDYIRQFAFPALQLKFSEVIGGEADRGTPMEDVDADIVVSDVQARIGRDMEARTRLQAILARTPNAARASTVLGLIDFRARRIKEALPLLERAAEQAPRDAFVQTSLGRALVALTQEQTTSEERTATAQRARTALSRAVDADPNSAYAIGLLGYVEMAASDDMTRAVSLLERAARLAPSHEEYRLLLAQALIVQGEFQRAITYLGPLLAKGTSDAVRSDARRLLGEAANRSSRAAEGTAGPAATASKDLVRLSTVSELALPTSTTAYRLDLRPVKDGETRVLGTFRAIECQREQILLSVDADGRLLRLRAKQFSDIDFVTYRSEPAGSVSCGPLPMPVRVLATYRAATAGGSDGDAVAIELLPDNYTPPR